MGEIVVADRVSLPRAPHEAFELIAAGGLPGWRLPSGSALRPGVPLSIPITLPDALGGQRIEILGRVVAVEDGRRIVIRHEVPWKGRVIAAVRGEGPSRSTVSVAATLDEEILAWAGRMTAPPDEPTGLAHRLGLLYSGSGPANVFSVTTRSAAQLGVEHVNADGGVLGRPLELVTGDDGTHPGLGAAELVRLAHAGCTVVLASVTSEVFQALRPVARRYGLLAIHTPLNEGGTEGPEVFRLGERPAAQAAAAIPALMSVSGGSRFYLAGNDYSWSRGAHRAVRRVIERCGGTIAGGSYAPLGTTDHSAMVEAIRASGADLVVSSLVGADEVSFEQQMYAAGMRARVQSLALVLDESTHEFIGPEASEGLWAAFSYFESLDTRANRDFVGAYRSRFGAGAAPVSSLTEGVYEAVHLVGRAAAAGGAWDPRVIGAGLRSGVTFDGPRGPVTTTATGLRQPMSVAVSQAGRLLPAGSSARR
ncbi:MAG: ABC transporter substrate-binding protein [Nocardioides sp.]|uniref:ABC transporter substrate-binding protein n=1 Tax=Nocardioides sp. TaxID=35761 RepID=UPI0039E71170